MFNINIDDKIKKLAERKRLYDLAEQTESQDERILLYNKARELAADVYNSVFNGYLKSLPLGHVVWSDDNTTAKVFKNNSKFSKYERIVRFSKNRAEKIEDHVYFDSKGIELLKELDQDALKLFCDLHDRKTKAKIETKRLEKALKNADAMIKLYHFDNGLNEIVLNDGRIITKEYYMGNSYIRVETVKS